MRLMSAERTLCGFKALLPGTRHGFLGTDQRGRDVFLKLIYGIRAQLIISISTLINQPFGAWLGLGAGYVGGWTDALIMRTVDILLSIPLAHLDGACEIWGKGLWQMVLSPIIFSWMGTACPFFGAYCS